MPTGVESSCEVVLLGVGVTVVVTCFVLVPPKVPMKLFAKVVVSDGAI
jgi:hypothetical protein